MWLEWSAGRRYSFSPSSHKVLIRCSKCGGVIDSERPIPFAFYGGKEAPDITWGDCLFSWLCLPHVADRLCGRFPLDFRRYEAFFLRSEHAGPYADAKERGPHKYKGPKYDEIVLAFDIKVPLPNPGIADMILFCDVCGRCNYKLKDTEQEPGEERIGDRWEPVPGRPREPGRGLLVPEAQLMGHEWFSVYRLWTFCTQAGRDFVLESGINNVTFLEVGETV
jgi:hypothetical protein